MAGSPARTGSPRDCDAVEGMEAPVVRGRGTRGDVGRLLALTVSVGALLLAATVALLVCFGHDALVAADARHLAWQHGRAADGDALAALYASTLEPVARRGRGAEGCLAPEAKTCLDGFCSLGRWRDHRGVPAFPCKGGAGGGLPSYELFERTVTAQGALGAAVGGGALLAAVLAVAVDDAAAPRFLLVAAPALALHFGALAYGSWSFFRALSAAAAVAFPHPAASPAASAHFGSLLGRGYGLVFAALALGAAAVARFAPDAARKNDRDIGAAYEAWRLAPAPDPDPVEIVDR